jgi:uncharacterized SAM-binding protein YcdF (DUF218 family)
MSNWNLELVSILKEFVFNASFFITLLTLCCLFLWIGLFYRFIKLAFAIFIALLILSCFQVTPRFLLDHLLSDQDKQVQANFLNQKNHPRIMSPLPPCVLHTNGIVVLGGGITTSGYPSSISMERVLGLAELIKKIQEQKSLQNKRIPILFSGGATREESQENEAQVLKNYYFYIYPKELKKFEIFLDSKSKNTYQNAIQSKLIFKKNFALKNIILVTSAFHMPRAKKTFENQGFIICPISTASSFLVESHFFSYKNTIATMMLLHEYFGILGYKTRGWL